MKGIPEFRIISIVGPVPVWRIAHIVEIHSQMDSSRLGRGCDDIKPHQKGVISGHIVNGIRIRMEMLKFCVATPVLNVMRTPIQSHSSTPDLHRIGDV